MIHFTDGHIQDPGQFPETIALPYAVKLGWAYAACRMRGGTTASEAYVPPAGTAWHSGRKCDPWPMTREFRLWRTGATQYLSIALRGREDRPDVWTAEMLRTFRGNFIREERPVEVTEVLPPPGKRCNCQCHIPGMQVKHCEPCC